MNLQERPRPPVFKDDLTEVFILREIFVAGIAREVGSKATMQSSDAHALSETVPPTVAFVK
jgi:hypothetical protein